MKELKWKRKKKKKGESKSPWQRESLNDKRKKHKGTSTFDAIILNVCFSCSLAELWIEEPLFTYAELLSYTEGKFDPKPKLHKLFTLNEELYNMIVRTLSRVPSERPSNLTEWYASLFLVFLSFFSCFVFCFVLFSLTLLFFSFFSHLFLGLSRWNNKGSLFAFKSFLPSHFLF